MQISGSGKNYVTMCVYKTACVCACVCVTISVILTHVVITDLTHHTPTLCVKQHVAPIRHPVAPLDGNSGAGTRTVHKIDQTKTKCNIPKLEDEIKENQADELHFSTPMHVVVHSYFFSFKQCFYCEI